jgi:hypothetical protein
VERDSYVGAAAFAIYYDSDCRSDHDFCLSIAYLEVHHGVKESASAGSLLFPGNVDLAPSETLGQDCY